MVPVYAACCRRVMKDGSEAVAETDGVMDLICVKPATALVDFNFEDTFYRSLF